jgi:hypothetical protein
MPRETSAPAHDAGPDGHRNPWAREAEGRRRVQARFPGWEVWVGIDCLWHARQPGRTARPATPSEPGSILTGKDPEDLMDQIRAWLGVRDS